MIRPRERLEHLRREILQVAATVVIHETRGQVPGSTASARRPEQRRMPLGADGSLGVAEYVIVAHSEPPQIILTRVQLY
ncbi:hypothetical protein [Streptomyces sp. BR123]|uniref:hypothetical protein n=1 Tax=Streptomyces sp. BR123 TaxID=2749828 RepID=UPI00211B506F|nr:hypothetical protein [Streptomyces sp. BR123]